VRVGVGVGAVITTVRTFDHALHPQAL
jgi:hypothetical protein